MLTFGIFFLSFTWRVVMESMHWSTDHHFLILFMTKRLMSHALGSLYASVRSTPVQRNYSCLELASCLHWQISYLEREESVKGCYGALTQGAKSHTFMLCGRFTGGLRLPAWGSITGLSIFILCWFSIGYRNIISPVYTMQGFSQRKLFGMV